MLAVGVVHLGDDADEAILGVVAPVDGQRVEHVAEGPGVGEHRDASALEIDASRSRYASMFAAEAPLGVTQMVAGLEARQEQSTRGNVGTASRSTSHITCW